MSCDQLVVITWNWASLDKLWYLSAQVTFSGTGSITSRLSCFPLVRSICTAVYLRNSRINWSAPELQQGLLYTSQSFSWRQKRSHCSTKSQELTRARWGERNNKCSLPWQVLKLSILKWHARSAPWRYQCTRTSFVSGSSAVVDGSFSLVASNKSWTFLLDSGSLTTKINAHFVELQFEKKFSNANNFGHRHALAFRTEYIFRRDCIYCDLVCIQWTISTFLFRIDLGTRGYYTKSSEDKFCQEISPCIEHHI